MKINSFEYGANDFIQTNQCNLIEAILEKNKNNKFDIFFDIVGNQSSLEIALRTVKANGKIITVGYENDNYIFEPKVIAQNEISIIGSRAGSKDDLQDCVKNINLNELKPVVKHEFKLKEINNAISLLKTKNNAGILELFNELISELKELNNLKKIESLEKKLINNLDENSYSELIKLKSQINRE